ncbi:MAG: class I SAM-dependent methyltransferase [Magnetococcales bacterium]|nr:class I SAM-dependent methyltransferase [Magnetococcales bacterium]
MSVMSSPSSLPTSDLFYQYYDALFSNKEYALEVAAINRLAKQWSSAKVGPVLEIGCGTGGHSLEIAKLGLSLTAIDLDLQMLKQTRKKLQDHKIYNVTLHHGPVENLEESGFSLAIAMFNVINYLPDSEGLQNFFRAISNRMLSGGVIIFDCWNGVAALRSPPGEKKSVIRLGEEEISFHLLSTTDLFRQRTILTYAIEVRDTTEKLVAAGEQSFMQTLWTPMQIMDAMTMAGLEISNCSPLHDLNKKADHNDWKIQFVGRKREQTTHPE